VAILKYYNTDTNQWEFVAANPTAKFTTWKKTAAGGETSLSGNDDNSVTLSYTPGLEQVFLNGVLLVRGTDYTATTGTSITGLSALVASDIVSIICYAPFNVGDAVAKTLIDAKGDLLAGTADNTAGRLAVGTNGQVLVADSGETTGLKWNDPGSVGGLVHIQTQSYSGVGSVNFDNVFSSVYDNYRILIKNQFASGTPNLNLRLRNNGTDDNAVQYRMSSVFFRPASATVNIANGSGASETAFTVLMGATNFGTSVIDISSPFLVERTNINFQATGLDGTSYMQIIGSGANGTGLSVDGFNLISSSGNISGTASVYGYRK
jgi:hypothetical protein